MFAQGLFATASLTSRVFAQPASPAALPPDPLLSREKFLPLVNTSFEAISESGEHLWLTLSSVDDPLSVPSPQVALAVPAKPARWTAPPLDTFMLNFIGVEETPAQQ